MQSTSGRSFSIASNTSDASVAVDSWVMVHVPSKHWPSISIASSSAALRAATASTRPWCSRCAPPLLTAVAESLADSSASFEDQRLIALFRQEISSHHAGWARANNDRPMRQ